MTPPHDAPSQPPATAAELPTRPLATVAADLAAEPLPPGYELLGEIARGGMGVVYKARQAAANRLVALKMLRPGPSAAPEDLGRFAVEVEAAAALDHPHIVPVFEVGAAAGRPFFTMKLVEGGSLAGWLRAQDGALAAGRPEAVRAAVRLLAQVARAVHYAHQRGILHRDLKPANILLDTAGHPYVADFGLARQVERDSRLTHSGQIMGTPSYMPPEQAAGRQGAITTASDTYSLGAILYEVLTGRPPFRAETVVETLFQVLHQDIVPPRQVRPGADAGLEAVCLKCLARDPAQRYGGAKALAEELERWLAGEPLTVRPASAARLAWQWLRKHWRAAAWVVLLGVGWGATTAAAVVLILLRTGFFVHYFYQSFPNVPRPTVIQAGEAFGLIGSSRDEGKAAGILGLALISVGSLVVGPLVARTIRAVDWRGDLAAGGATALVASIVAFCLAVGPACACLAVGNVEKDLELLAYGYATHGPRAAGQLIHPQEEIVRRYPDLQAVPEEYRGLQLRSKIHGDLWAACFHGLWWGLFSTVVVFLPFGLIQTALAGQVRRRGSGWKVAWAESLDLGLAGLIAGLVGASFITGGIQQGLAIGVGQLVIALVLVTGFQFVPLVLPVLLFSYRWRWWQRWLAYSAFLLFPIGGWVFRSLTR